MTSRHEQGNRKSRIQITLPGWPGHLAGNPATFTKGCDRCALSLLQNAPGCAHFSTHGGGGRDLRKTTQARQKGPGARPGASSILGVAYSISMRQIAATANYDKRRAPPASPEITRGARRALGPPRAPSPSHPIPQVDGAARACLCFVAGLGRGSTGVEPGHWPIKYGARRLDGPDPPPDPPRVVHTKRRAWYLAPLLRGFLFGPGRD